MKRSIAFFSVLLILLPLAALAGGQEEKGTEEGKLNAGTFAGLKLRCIGPALMSGRISDILENGQRRHHLDTDLRPLRLLLDRLRHRRPQQPPGRLGRNGREQQPAQRRLGRRSLQEPRRRQELQERRPEEV